MILTWLERLADTAVVTHMLVNERPGDSAVAVQVRTTFKPRWTGDSGTETILTGVSLGGSIAIKII